MRLFMSGSAPLLAETHDEFRAKTGHAILERYGMTETNMNTSNPYDGDRIAGTVGFPLPGVELRIADPESGAVLTQGEIGVIEVKGPNVFPGYWRMPDKTKAEFRADGFFITGDVGKIDERGYVHIVGRAKDLIITGGFNVYPKEVESEIDALPGVVESAVIGCPHPDFGEGVTAVVVLQKGASARREGDHRRSRRQARQVQAAQARDFRRRPAAQHHGQGAEERAARAERQALCLICADIGRACGIKSCSFGWSGADDSQSIRASACDRLPSRGAARAGQAAPKAARPAPRSKRRWPTTRRR